ncbi:helicase-related protein [bacterium]|nr:helicase-related protein [bacterium]
MTKALNISDFIPSYPEISDKNFTYDIARRKEFNELKLEISEDQPQQAGIPMKHQKLMSRFFSPYTEYKGGLLFHEMGTGKTCVISLIVENYKKVNGRKALVFVKNKDLQLDFINKVATQCTKDVYIPKFKEGETSESRWKATSRLIKNQYEFVTYDKFLSKKRNGILDKQNYSNRVIILDEIQNVRVQPKKKKKNYVAEEEIPDIIESETFDIKGLPERGSRYGNLWHFLHDVDNCQIILASGTPIKDLTSEIASQLNLILPSDEQLPVKTKFYEEFFDDDGLTETGKQILKGAFRGRISFLRQQTTIARRKEIGVSAPWLKHIKIFPDGMSQFQYEVVKKCSTEEGGTTESLHINSRHASNFVMPSEDKVEYDRTAFNRIAKQQKKRPGQADKYKYQINNNYVKNEIRTNLEYYSSKYASILKILNDNPNEAVFIYNDFVTGSGGVIMMGLIFQLLGWQWIKTASGMNTPAPPDSKGRFAVITGTIGDSPETTTNKPADITELLNRFSKPDNRYGERCRIIIGSSKISEGFDIKNVRQVHVVMPHWNEPRIHQALGRVLRIGSHNAFEREDEKYVNIYRHVAVKTWDEDEDYDTPIYNEGKGFPPDVGFTAEKTDDIEIYIKAQNKEIKNVQIYRLIKEIAWDCPLNYARNVTGLDEEGSRACDYQNCNYTCDNFEPSSKEERVWKYDIVDSEIIYDTYNLYYSSSEIKDVIGDVIDVFGYYFSLTWDMVKNFVETNDENLLLKALDIIINKRIKIKNRYGFYCYLKEDGNIYFLDQDISSCWCYSESIYSSRPLITEEITFDDLVEFLQLTNNQILVLQFCKNPSPNLLDEMYYKSLIIVLEVVYDKKWRYDHGEIKMSPRLKKVIDTAYSKLKNELYKMSDGNVVHIMYISEYTGLGYNVTMKDISIKDNIRIYNTKTRQWEGVDNIELKKKYITQIKHSNKKQNLTEDIRGIVDQTGLFKIQNKQYSKGRDCKTLYVDTLIDFVHEFNIELDDRNYLKFSKDQLITKINKIQGFDRYKIDLKNKNENEIRQLYTLLDVSKSKNSKEILCNFIQEYLSANNRIDYK